MPIKIVEKTKLNEFSSNNSAAVGIVMAVN